MARYDDYDEDDFEAREKALEKRWRDDFGRAADSLHDIGTLMMHLSDLMKVGATANLSPDTQFRFYSRCMRVVQAAREFSEKMQSIYAPKDEYRPDHE